LDEHLPIRPDDLLLIVHVEFVHFIHYISNVWDTSKAQCMG
jgi:hypothetical protein